MLAKNPRTPGGVRLPASALTTIASRLAPTVNASPVAATDPRRSEHARDGLKNTAGNQTPRVSVDDHREQARSYRLRAGNSMSTFKPPHSLSSNDSVPPQASTMSRTIPNPKPCPSVCSSSRVPRLNT